MGLNTQGIKAGRAFVLIDAVDQTGAVLANVKRRFLQVGTELTNIGRGLFTKGIAAALPLGLGLKVFMDFDDAMRAVAARSQGTAEEMGALRDQAIALGRATAFTAAHVGHLQAMLAQKGYKRADILGMTENILNLARAAPGIAGNLDTDMIMAAELVSGILKAYQMDAGKSNRIADMMTVAINNSNYSLEEMIVTMQYAGAAATTFGMSLEETLATVAVLRDMNLDASIVGTAFRNMPTYMTQKKATDDFNARLSELTGKTIEFTDANRNMHSLPRILGAMGKAMEGLGTTDVGGMFYELFGTRAQIPATAFTRSVGRFDEMLSFFKQFEGQAKKTHDTMESGVGGVWRELVSVVEDLGIALGESLEPALMMVGKLFQDWGRNLSQFMRENKGLVTLIAAVSPAMIILGAAFFSVGAAIIFVTPILTFFGTITTIVSYTLYGLFVAINLTWSAMVIFATTVWTLLGTTIPAFIISLIGLIGTLATLVAQIWTAVIPSLIAMGAALGANLMAAIATLAVMLGTVMAPFLAEIAAVVIVLGAVAAFIGIWLYLLGQLPDLISQAISGFMALGPAIGNGLTGLLAKFKPEAQAVFDFIKERAFSIFDTLSLVYEAITIGVQSGQMERAWEGVAQGIKIVWLKLIDSMMDAWEKLPLAILESFAKLNHGMQEMMTAIQVEVGMSMLPQNLQDKLRKEMNLPTFEQRLDKLIFPGDEANRKREKDIELEEANLRFLLEEMTAIAAQKELLNPRNMDRFLDPNLHKTQVDDLIKGGGVSGIAPANMALSYGTAEAAKAIAENFMNAEETVDTLKAMETRLNDIFNRLNTLNHIDENIAIIAELEGV